MCWPPASRLLPYNCTKHNTTLWLAHSSAGRWPRNRVSSSSSQTVSVFKGSIQLSVHVCLCVWVCRSRHTSDMWRNSSNSIIINSTHTNTQWLSTSFSLCLCLDICAYVHDEHACIQHASEVSLAEHQQIRICRSCDVVDDSNNTPARPKKQSKRSGHNTQPTNCVV